MTIVAQVPQFPDEVKLHLSAHTSWIHRLISWELYQHMDLDEQTIFPGNHSSVFPKIVPFDTDHIVPFSFAEAGVYHRRVHSRQRPSSQ